MGPQGLDGQQGNFFSAEIVVSVIHTFTAFAAWYVNFLYAKEGVTL